VVAFVPSCTLDAAAGLLSESAAARSTGALNANAAASAASAKILIPFIAVSTQSSRFKNARATRAHRSSPQGKLRQG